jgi:sugar/nucleoside kinase (ribokinase family)
MKQEKILAVGAALVDLLLQESEEFLQSLQVPKGGMNLVSMQAIEAHLAQSAKTYAVSPGGSACNTAVGIGKLGGDVAFAGMIGQDTLGDMFLANVQNANVKAYLQTTDTGTGTGRVLSVITPDAQRTMFTDLGAAALMNATHLQPQWFTGVQIVLVEGYLAFNAEYFSAVIQMAKQAGCQVALDLSSFDVIQFCRAALDSAMPHIDILIANEEEARAFTNVEDNAQNVEILSQLAPIAVVKVGSKGSLIAHQGKIIQAQAVQAKAIDTTGAGDLWASGFLLGISRGMALRKMCPIR